MTITQEVVRRIINNLLKGQDYRIEVVGLIDAEFLQYTIDFFKKVIEAKLSNQAVSLDWYKKEFLSPSLPKNDIAINSGLNMKTIHNMYNSSTAEIVLDASNEHYDLLYQSIQELIDNNEDLNLTLTLKLKDVSVDLTINETLIVVNSLAVKRAQLRGGLWSAAGKRVEKPLMELLCKLYGVSPSNYKIKFKRQELNEDEFEREIDFYLIDISENEYKCEVKLMGKGNPESADAFFARESKVFVADTLSNTNKNQLNANDVLWVELRSPNGFEKFQEVLSKLGIPHEKKFNPKNVQSLIDVGLSEIFSKATS